MRLSVVVITVSAALVLAIALAGAQEPATEYLAGYDVLRTGVSPYEFKFPPVLSWQFTTGEKNADEPVAGVAVGPDLVYAPVGSNLYGLDRQTGQQKWKLSLGGKCFCTPVVAGDVVYVGTENKQLVAVNAKAGQRLWAFPTTAAVRGEPLLFENTLYFGTDDGRLFALDLESRQLRWYFEAGGKIRGGPAYYRDAVYCASDDGYLYALSTKDGHQVWNTNLGTTDVFSAPIVARGRILIGAGNSLLAVDVANGAVDWSFQTYGMVASRPALKDRMIFLGSADGSLYCLNAGNGKAIWRYPKQGALQPVTSSPSIQGDSVVFRSGPRLLVALSTDQNTPADKRLVWQYTLPQPPAKRQTTGGAPGATPGGPGGP
ncbi:MAG: PQQ-binding-like beta-propeller repeat protein, partial [Armatimonadetes bacterium]|nr:PQQ-binding-like beta-propeller repeat protein [Armatimonadota bacterium]